MRLTQTLSDAVDEQKYVGAVFFDLKKAFDRVWHKGLLAKIRFAGVTGGAHEWLASYLSERDQVTLVDGQLSSTNKLHAGVPQGAILSPLLFCVLFIPSLVRVRRPCRGLEKFFPPVLQRCYGCSFHAQEIVHTGHGMLGYFCFFLLERKVPAQSKLKE